MDIAFLLSRQIHTPVWIICLAMITTAAEGQELDRQFEAEIQDNKIAEIFVREGDSFTLTTRSFEDPVQWYIHGKELSLWRQSNLQEYLALNVSTKWNSTTGENFLHVVHAIPAVHSGSYSCGRANHYPDGVAKRISLSVKVRSVKEEAMAKSQKMEFDTPAIWSTKRPGSPSFISMDSVGKISYGGRRTVSIQYVLRRVILLPYVTLTNDAWPCQNKQSIPKHPSAIVHLHPSRSRSTAQSTCPSDAQCDCTPRFRMSECVESLAKRHPEVHGFGRAKSKDPGELITSY
ncbi:uncharacterized protein LOC129602427 [Paramacrobiotus metropolitanus]|uniref:uncharacterized protein LOC129602427 n=1 Tax=Paramacrobiotus metropolitanus TaxID=2943436 RepID=UPI0024460AE9|nr:uncharacterized protein LOC129602427 [Paramacrobiotus metropolitanus]